MKVARFSRVRPVLTIGELFGSTDSGPSGQVPTATGSNGNPIIWGSNVANIFSNTSNHLLSPDVNFASGAGIAFAASSNTLTISSTASGGGASPTTTATAAKVNRWHIGAFSSTNAHATTITAASSGQRMLVAVATRAADVTSVTCTNTTFTEVLAGNFGTTAFLSVYLGVVAGGASGTTVTANVGGVGFVFSTVVILDDTLSGSVVNSATLSNTDATAINKTVVGPITCSVGDFVVMAWANSDATTAVTLFECSSPLFLVPRDTLDGLVVAVGRAAATEVSGYYTGGTSGADAVIGIVAFT